MNFIFSQNMIADELIKSLSQQNFKRFIEQLRLKSSESWETCKHQVKVLRSAMTNLFLAVYCDNSEFNLNSVRLVSNSSF